MLSPYPVNISVYSRCCHSEPSIRYRYRFVRSLEVLHLLSDAVHGKDLRIMGSFQRRAQRRPSGYVKISILVGG